MTIASRIDRSRLDELVVARGLADTRSRARALILAGDISVNGQVVHRAGAMVRAGDELGRTEKARFASRGGEKLAHALQVFGIDVTGQVAADLGASTGGFTDCLLQAGAERVYAVDVGYGQILDRLRRDPRVVVMDRTNARSVLELPEPIDIVTIDVSFISLRLVLPAAVRVLTSGGAVVPLIKPQFEAGPKDVKKGGVVRDPAVHTRVLEEVLTGAEELGFAVHGVTASPLKGPAGNREFLAYLQTAGESRPLAGLIADAVAEAHAQ
ncbi:MAG: TlyA family RNA methyltransferase [Chloroflexota bacterium]|nr:TlyA family RNA methyltransferase [Chloroflexota bacterium]